MSRVPPPTPLKKSKAQLIRENLVASNPTLKALIVGDIVTSLKGMQFKVLRLLSGSKQQAENDFSVFEVVELSPAAPHFVLKQSVPCLLSNSDVFDLNDPLKWVHFEVSETGHLTDRCRLLRPRQWMQETAVQRHVAACSPGLVPNVHDAWFSPVADGEQVQELRRYHLLMDLAAENFMSLTHAFATKVANTAVSSSNAMSLSNAVGITPTDATVSAHLCTKPLVLSVVRAVRRLHKTGVIHADLQPSHVLCNPWTSQVQLIDFGVSRFVEQNRNFHIDAGLDGAGPYLDFSTLQPKSGLPTVMTDWVALIRILEKELPFISST